MGTRSILKGTWPVLIGLMGTALLFACGGDGQGTLEMRLADISATTALSAPEPGVATLGSGVEAITVIFDRVMVHRSAAAGENDAGWIEVLDDSLPDADRTFDLLTVAAGNFDVLGVTTLAAGKYQQIRVIIEDASITISGATSPLTVSSGAQTGLKLNHNFTVVEDQETTLTLDFDAEQSVKEEPASSGMYRIDPVIGIVQ